MYRASMFDAIYLVIDRNVVGSISNVSSHRRDIALQRDEAKLVIPCAEPDSFLSVEL